MATPPYMPDPLYVAQTPLQQVIFDKDGSGPLAAGVVTYYSDPGFSVLKDVYEQSNDPITGEFTYTNIGSQLILSNIGSFVDLEGNNFIPILYPWFLDPITDILTYQPYYITVYNAGGVFQFSATGWPLNEFSEENVIPVVATPAGLNQITDPQFVEVLFHSTPGTTPGSYTYSVSGTGTITAIAPNWYLNTTGTGSVTVSQVQLAIDIASNAPYALQITSSGISALTLFQRIDLSPRLFNHSTVSAYFEAASTNGAAQVLTLNYISYTNGTANADVQLATGTTSTDQAFHSISGYATIPASPINVDNQSPYVDISLTIPVGASLQLTSFQLLGASNTAATIMFDEISTPLQKALLFGYWQPKLEYKPIPSYLVGWDFPLNPTQPLGPGPITQTLSGTNLSAYYWDQTIIYQPIDNTITVNRSTTTGGLKISTSSSETFAVIQYLPQAQAREILSQRNAISIKGAVSTGTIFGTVGLYWTTAALPNITSGNYFSLVSLVTDGSTNTPPTPPVTSVGGGSSGTWTQVPNLTLGNSAAFTLTTTDSPQYFSGFDATATAAGTTATAIAIVVSFNKLVNTSTVTLDYVSLNGGDIATRPAPQTPDEVLRECQHYFETNYDVGTAPGTASTTASQAQSLQRLNSTSCLPGPFEIVYNVTKRVAPTSGAVVFYSPVTGASTEISAVALAPNGTPSGSDVASNNWNIQSVGTKGITYTAATTNTLQTTSGATQAYINYFYTADARLGVV